MASTTNFDDWLAVSAPDSAEDAFSLHDALQGADSGIYKASKVGDRVLITRGDFTIVLASEAARAAFEDRIVQYNPHPELGWHGAEIFVKSQAKD